MLAGQDVFVLFKSSDLILICLLESEHKKTLGVYKIFSSSDLTLLLFKRYNVLVSLPLLPS